MLVDRVLLVAEIGSADVVKGDIVLMGINLTGFPKIIPSLHSTRTTRNLIVNI
jgi:hypothetical protein